MKLLNWLFVYFLFAPSVFAQVNICHYPKPAPKESDSLRMAGDDRFWPWGYELSYSPNDWSELDGVWRATSVGDCTNRLGMKVIPSSDSKLYPDVTMVLFDPVLCRPLARGLGRTSQNRVTFLMNRRADSSARSLRPREETFGGSIRPFAEGFALRAFTFPSPMNVEPNLKDGERAPQLLKETSLVYTNGLSVTARKDDLASSSIRAVIPCEKGFIDF